jgi:hypothetical protein
MLEEIKNKASIKNFFLLIFNFQNINDLSIFLLFYVCFLWQSCTLKPVMVKKPNFMGPYSRTNLKVAAMLEKANAIRQVGYFGYS